MAAGGTCICSAHIREIYMPPRAEGSPETLGISFKTLVQLVLKEMFRQRCHSVPSMGFLLGCPPICDPPVYIGRYVARVGLMISALYGEIHTR